MTALALLTLLLLALLPAGAEPVVSHAGDVWSLENAAIKAEVNTATGRLQVLDKRCGYVWKGAGAVVEKPAQVLIPAARQTATPEGEPAERATDGVKIALTPDMLAHARKVDGAEDLSATVRALWYPHLLCLAIEVRDEKLVFAAEDEQEWWFKDSVEFWLNDRQYAVRFGPWGANVWSSAGAATDARALFRQNPSGYELEVFLPAQLLGAGDMLRVGQQFRFAIGVNDCDGDDGRQGQLYFPTTWVHSDPDTFAVATLADADGKLPAGVTPTGPEPVLRPVQEGPGGAAVFDTTISSRGEKLPVRVTLALDGDRPDLLITVASPDENVAVGRFGVLHPLVLDRPGGRILGAAYCNGIGVPTDDLSWAGREWVTFGSLDMPWVGLTDGDIGYMLLWELPVSCDNGAVRFERVRVGERELLAPGAYHYGIKGKFGSARTVRYSFVSDGGHVAICKRYRQYAHENGFLVTQKEKLQRKPELAKLAGAPDVWGRSDLAFCREAKAAGIDRLLVNGGQAAKDMEEIKALGYLISTYDNYEDAYEGDRGHYGDFKAQTDAVVLANGELMKAWITHDTPPKQFMKRCTALFEPVARKWIPLDLQQHPYNARFLDVTTACGLLECYSPVHGLDRTADREARRRLAKYVGDELNLVLGGEHGRWFGADIYNYWEGMQSGGFYSWPAGYVGEKIPERREDIGKQYLEWGLGEKNRYPLWELVFHDCVVSTWYWGDSTGHLRQAAPELGYKQDAFNVLYGTVPLYWVNQDFSYRWDNPATRARLLESYRNTCKLHEAIGFEELVSHEFVTADRAVQRTVFGDGTEVWVNFGEQPWTLAVEGQEYLLPQYGFYAKGPKIEQYRVLKEWQEEDLQGIDEAVSQVGGLKNAATGGIVTYIRTGDYLFVSGNLPGVVESFLGTPVTIRREGEARLRVNAAGAKWVRINWRALCPEAGEGDWRLVELDAEGAPARLGTAIPARGDLLLLPVGAPLSPAVLLGPRALADMSELSFAAASVVTVAPAAPKQGDKLTLTVKVANQGGKDASGVGLSAYLGSARPENRIGTARTDIPGGATVEVPFEFDTALYDGTLEFSFVVNEDRGVQELCTQDNTARFECRLEPDWSRWDSFVDVTVEAGPIAREVEPVRLPFDADAERAKLGKPGQADPQATRVALLDEAGQPGQLCPTQYLTGEPQERELVWMLAAALAPGESARYRIYMDGMDHHRHRLPQTGRWDPEEQTYWCGTYGVQFREGYIRRIFVSGGNTLIGNMGVSSKDTGWVDERGEVESFEVVQDGPILTQIRVRKKLEGGHFYDKLYSFWGQEGGFTVTTASPERFGTLSRAYYRREMEYEDDKGNRARIDGKGDAENIMGSNPNPKWYVTWDDAYVISCVAVTRHDNVCYWDAGGSAWAGLGFTTGDPKPATVAYFIHRRQEGVSPVQQAVQDYERVHNPITVRR